MWLKLFSVTFILKNNIKNCAHNPVSGLVLPTYSAGAHRYDNNLGASHYKRYNNLHNCCTWVIKFRILNTRMLAKIEDE